MRDSSGPRPSKFCRGRCLQGEGPCVVSPMQSSLAAVVGARRPVRHRKSPSESGRDGPARSAPAHRDGSLNQKARASHSADFGRPCLAQVALRRVRLVRLSARCSSRFHASAACACPAAAHIVPRRPSVPRDQAESRGQLQSKREKTAALQRSFATDAVCLPRSLRQWHRPGPSGRVQHPTEHSPTWSQEQAWPG